MVGGAEQVRGAEQLGARTAPRPVFHVIAAGLVGAAAAFLAHVGVVVTFLSGLPGAVVLLFLTAAVGLLLGVLAVLATGRRTAGWAGLVGLVAVPGAAALHVVALLGSGSTAGATALTPSALAFTAAVVLAVLPVLIVHRARVGAALVAAAAVVLATVVLSTVLR